MVQSQTLLLKPRRDDYYMPPVRIEQCNAVYCCSCKAYYDVNSIINLDFEDECAVCQHRPAGCEYCIPAQQE